MILLKIDVRLFSLIAVALVFSDCSSNLKTKKEKIEKTDSTQIVDGKSDIHGTELVSNYNRIEIYCWCFLSAKPEKDNEGYERPNGSLCTTWARVNPTDLIKPKHLLESITNPGSVEAVQKLIFFGGKIISANQEPDSRFLILFRRNDSTADTVVYRDNFSMFFNDKLLTYHFNVMDSIRKVLNEETISCPSN